VGGSDAGMVVVASAPRLANGMTVAVAIQRSIFGGGDGVAMYQVSFNGQAIYPPGGVVGAPIEMVEGRGSAFIPYTNFVVDNGDYVVSVDFEGKHSEARATVEKWVNWVYVFPYLRNDTVVAEMVLERSEGQPSDRIFASGQINLQLRYRGENGTSNETRLTRVIPHDGLTDFERTQIPLTSIEQGDRNRGYYSVEATFQNLQAMGNNNVPLDPTLGQPNPPTNWVYLDLPDRCTATVALPPPLPCPPVER
jgi:hypothetical protein